MCECCMSKSGTMKIMRILVVARDVLMPTQPASAQQLTTGAARADIRSSPFATRISECIGFMRGYEARRRHRRRWSGGHHGLLPAREAWRSSPAAGEKRGSPVSNRRFANAEYPVGPGLSPIAHDSGERRVPAHAWPYRMLGQ